MAKITLVFSTQTSPRPGMQYIIYSMINLNHVTKSLTPLPIKFMWDHCYKTHLCMSCMWYAVHLHMIHNYLSVKKLISVALALYSTQDIFLMPVTGAEIAVSQCKTIWYSYNTSFLVLMYVFLLIKTLPLLITSNRFNELTEVWATDEFVSSCQCRSNRA